MSGEQLAARGVQVGRWDALIPLYAMLAALCRPLTAPAAVVVLVPGAALLALHVVVDDVLFLLFAVLAEGRAAAAEISEELRAVVVELLGKNIGDPVIDVAGGNVSRFFSVFRFVEFLDDQDAVDEILHRLVLGKTDYGINVQPKSRKSFLTSGCDYP